jgi:hypothetical protein
LLHIAAKEYNCPGIYESITDYKMSGASNTPEKTGKECKNLIRDHVIEQRGGGLNRENNIKKYST